MNEKDRGCDTRCSDETGEGEVFGFEVEEVAYHCMGMVGTSLLMVSFLPDSVLVTCSLSQAKR